MKATLSLLILLTFALGFVMAGSALAQPSDAAPTTEETAAPTEPVAGGGPFRDAGVPAPNTEPEPAAEAEPATTDKPLEQGKGLYNSVKGGEWLLAFGFLGMLLGSIARFTIGKKWEFLKSKAGGYTIAGFTGMGILGALIVEAGAFSLSMLTPAILATTAAMAMHGPAKALKEKIKGPSEA